MDRNHLLRCQCGLGIFHVNPGWAREVFRVAAALHLHPSWQQFVPHGISLSYFLYRVAVVSPLTPATECLKWNRASNGSPYCLVAVIGVVVEGNQALI